MEQPREEEDDYTIAAAEHGLATARVRRAYPEETCKRLAGIQAIYDPHNLFQLNQNLRPRTGYLRDSTFAARPPRILSTSAGTHTQAFGSAEWALFSSLSLIWGASFLFMDMGLDAFHPGLVTWLRVSLGAAVLWLVPRARGPIEREDWPRLVTLSVAWVALPFTLFPIAQQWISSAVAGMLNGGLPIFAATIGALMLRRIPRGGQLPGLLVGLVGVVPIALPSVGKGDAQALGVALVLLATACYGLAVNISVPLLQRYGSAPVMARMLALAVLWTAPFGIGALSESIFLWSSFLAVTALGVVGTGLAYALAGSLARRVGATRSSFITYVVPVVALVLGVVFRGDEVTGLAVAGVVLVIGGAILASRREA
jgi:drug/metabolite transporter (DMT)-like permease